MATPTSSHQLALVEDLCEDVVIIDHGRVVLGGAVAELREASPWRRVDITVVGGDAGWFDTLEGVTVELRDNGRVRLLVDRSPATLGICSTRHTSLAR
jgi:ABC-2 type transport system ATP-binding protein